MFLTGVIYPIQNFTAVPLSVHKFGENLSLKWKMDDGTKVSVAAFYNNISCCNTSGLSYAVDGSCNCLISNPDLFDPDSIVNIRFFAWNSISNKTDEIEVETQSEIQNISISVSPTDSAFGTVIKERPPNVFPAEYPVRISSIYQRGPAKDAFWVFRCTVSGLTFEEGFSFEKMFPSNISQSCGVSLLLKNNFSEVLSNTTIFLKESIILESFTGNGPIKVNTTMTFTILFEKPGTESCTWVDLGDNSSIVVVGRESCASKFDVSNINPNILIEPKVRFISQSSGTNKITINHVYSQTSSYDVRMSASNDISMIKEQTTAVVVPLECHKPNVTISGTIIIINVQLL